MSWPRCVVVATMRTKTTSIIALGAVAVLVGFLLFRPDKVLVNDAVDENLDEAFAAEPSDGQGAERPTTDALDQAASTSNADVASTTTSATGESAEPTAVSSGAFSGIEHRAAGTTSIYEQDGQFVLRLEDDTDIQNGPDLFVWLLEADSYSGGDPGTFVDLGKLKGNIGGQNYVLPDGFDPDVHRTVLIWCVRFGVPFAAASLT